MNNEFEVSFIHTEPCFVCKGSHIEYRTRQCCRNCDSLYEAMIKRGLLILPRTSAKGSKVIPDIAKRISTMKAAGASISDIAKATGLAKDTVSGYIKKANKVAGTGYGQAKRSNYRMTPEQQQEIIRMAASGQTDSEIACQMGVCARTVYNVLNRHGLKSKNEVHV